MKLIEKMWQTCKFNLNLDKCDIEPDARKECGYMGIKQPECESKGCCWSPLENGSKAPWCFFPAKKGEFKKYRLYCIFFNILKVVFIALKKDEF